MRLDFTIVSLPGNVINLTEYIFIEPRQVFYTAANWTNQAVLLIDGESESFIILPCLCMRPSACAPFPHESLCAQCTSSSLLSCKVCGRCSGCKCCIDNHLP